ncbi:unnamed protein product [Pleuronectes platessa]|uniref:Uncharacterized protein n=1 Tax=Pleuronectes platessa TaxID=8262 RepID=A0A9N7UQG2_PLEPL|nr:unnamed protein product [Pleuronectes platessa]
MLMLPLRSRVTQALSRWEAPGVTVGSQGLRDTRPQNCLETDEGCKKLEIWGVNFTVREDMLPLIPGCQPVLCCEADAVAKKLNELAMNFPHGCHREEEVHSRLQHPSEAQVPLSNTYCRFKVS